jgi:sodium-independent sulfate anion transporter 11
LSAIIVSAVWPIILPPKTFWQYWRTSFADFIASMVSFWVTLFVSVEIGIASAVAYSLVYLLLHIAFTRVTLVTPDNISTLYPSQTVDAASQETIPDGTLVFKINESILYPNAYRIKTSILNYAKTLKSGIEQDRPEPERLWNEAKGEHLKIAHQNDTRPKLLAIILDVGSVTYVDTTGVQALTDLKADLQVYAGESFVLKFLDMNSAVRTRFERASWELRNGENATSNNVRDSGDMVFDFIQTALSTENKWQDGVSDATHDVKAGGDIV